MSVFYERTDSRPKGGFIALIGLIVTVVTAGIAFLLIQKTGAWGFAAILLPMGALIVAGIALRRAKEGVKKGYALSSDDIEEIAGENRVVLRFRDIRKTRRVLDRAGYSLHLVLYPETGSPMRVTQLSGPDATAIDTFVESSLPADVERVVIRETRAASTFRQHGGTLHFILLYCGIQIAHYAPGSGFQKTDIITLLLMVIVVATWSWSSKPGPQSDDYEGKLSGPKMLVLTVTGLAYMAFQIWNRAGFPLPA